MNMWKRRHCQYKRRYLLCVMGVFLLTACHSATSVENTGSCIGYSDSDTSQYILPYEMGAAYEVIQGNCAPKRAPWTHYEQERHAYDFGMPIGTKILASRAGTVIFVREQFTDNDHKQEQGNAVVVLHDDNTVALYGHMTQNGVLVELGQQVEQGEIIALSGNSGQSPVPHLHFQVNACPDFDACESLPITFRNALPNPGRLIQGEHYTAESFNSFLRKE